MVLQAEWKLSQLLLLGACLVAGLGGTRTAAQAAPGAPAAQPRSGEESSGQVVHILVGHSVVIHTEARLKRILVGNPAVLSTTTTAPDELVATATAPGSSSLILWHDNGQSRIIEVFADVDVSMLRDAVERGLPGQSVQVEAEEGRIVLTGTVSAQALADQVGKMAAPFSKDVVNSIRVAQATRQKQVLLKVRFAEVDRTKLDTFGFNLFSTGAANTIGTVSTQQFGGTALGTGGKVSGGGAQGTTSAQMTISDLLNIFVFRPDINLGATLKDLQQKQVLQILAEPNLMAMSGEPAQFLAGGELPYPIVQGGGAGTVPTVTVQFKQFGVKLDFTGTVEGDAIRLKVAPEVSSLDFSNSITISGFVLPAVSTRRAETVVELKDGQSFVIAGLLDKRTTVQLSKVPGIGDLPILGQLFRSRSVNRSNTELLVIVTPTIVDPFAAASAPELPKAPVKPMDPAQFDKKLPKGDGSNNR
ncbi:MAG: pilus assembly protein N-terminal domain-containing protein [Acidobacteriia bacterium]|nr:pilus assembly protein N-terminal domain-containing protein [Terriglobia bacterium]